MKVRTNIGVLLLAFTMLLGNIRAGLYFSYYLIDKESFIENFCENVAKPELHCDGKCKLTEVTDDNQKTPDFDFNKLKTDFHWIIEYIPSYSDDFTNEDAIVHTFHYKDSYLQPFHYSIFHPPILG